MEGRVSHIPNNLKIYSRFIIFILQLYLFFYFSTYSFLLAQCSVIPVSMLPKEVLEPLVGNLLGDGNLSYINKNKYGKYVGNV
jgi:hypothetical protein